MWKRKAKKKLRRVTFRFKRPLTKTFLCEPEKLVKKKPLFHAYMITECTLYNVYIYIWPIVHLY